MIHKLAPEGATLATFGGYGVKPGEFLYPVAAAVASDDSVLVLDAGSDVRLSLPPEGGRPVLVHPAPCEKHRPTSPSKSSLCQS